MDRNNYSNWIVCSSSTFNPFLYLCTVQALKNSSPRIRLKTNELESQNGTEVAKLYSVDGWPLMNWLL